MKFSHVFLFLFVTFFLGFLHAENIIIPPLETSVSVPLQGKWEKASGGFMVEFRSHFSTESKLHVGHIAGARKWSKPQTGFLFGLNRHENGETFIWFYPVDTEGKPYGFYTSCPIADQEKTQAEVGWTSNRFYMIVNGKKIAEGTLQEPLKFADRLEVGGLGGKNCGVEVLRFEILDSDPISLRKKSSLQVLPVDETVLSEILEDTQELFRFLLENHKEPATVELRPQNFPIHKNETYYIDSSGPDGPFRVRAEEDGLLKFTLPIQIRSCFAVSPDPGNLLPESLRQAQTIEKNDNFKSLEFPLAKIPVKAGVNYLGSVNYHVLKGKIGSGFGLLLRVYCNGKQHSKKDNRSYYSFPLWETSREKPGYCFESISIPEGKPGDSFELELAVELSGAASAFYLSKPELMLEPPRAKHHGKPKGPQRNVSWQEVAEKMAEKAIVTAEVRQDNGIPRVYFNGELQKFLPVMVCSDEQLYAAKAAGCQLYVVNLPVNNWCRREGSIWRGPDEYDWEVADRKLAQILAINPDAKIYIKIGAMGYVGFADDHPESKWVTADGKSDVNFFNTVPEKAFSLIGLNSRRVIGDFLHKFARYLGSSPLGRSIVAVHISGGSDGQWYPPVQPWHFKNFDYSEDSRRAMAEEIRKLYNNELDKLRKAWNLPEIEFETITIPSFDELTADSDFLDFTNPAHRRVIECSSAYQKALLSSINFMAEKFKTGFGRNILTTTYAPSNMIIDKTSLLASANLDGFVFLSAYLRPRSPGGACGTGHLRTSAAIHGKLMIEEVDFRNEYFGIKDFPMRRWYGMAANDLSYRGTLLRNFAQAYTHGNYAWIRPIGNDSHMAWTGFYQSHMEQLSKLAELAASLPSDNGYADVISFLADDYMHHLSYRKRFDHYMNYLSSIKGDLTYSGLKTRTLLLSDLSSAERPDAPIMFFTGCASLNPQQLEYIKKHLQNNQRILIFANDVGRNSETGFSRTLFELTGIRAEENFHQSRPSFLFPAPDSPYGINDLPRFDVWMREFSMPEIKILPDPHLEVIATLESGEPGAVIKRHADWTAVYLSGAAGTVSSFEFWSAMGKLANLPQTKSLGDVTAEGRGLRMIHAATSGKKTLPPSENGDWFDVFSGEKAGSAFDMQFGETRIFQFKSR